MIQIDPNSCIGCKACIKDCPAGAIRLEEGKAVWKKECIQCGHCVAVCPVKAVSIPEYDMEEVEEYDRDTFTLDPQIFLHAVKFRRSIRDYKETPVERGKMERILNAGRYAATAKNTQGCRFLFLQKDLEAFKDLVWEEMPGIVEGLKETLPAYARLFEFFCLRRKRNPKDDPLFFNTTSFLVITAKGPAGRRACGGEH
ncbi:MAG: nitroreductase family protein [Lachnospiraceae bacterium]